MSQKSKSYALLSVTDKTNLPELGAQLVQKGYTLLASGGTRDVLEKASLPVTPVEEISGHAEAFGGRMKTLSFPIASGILYKRGDARDEAQALERQTPAIDIVVCNFYPFEEQSSSGLSTEELIEYIDIGGPTMVRAAAKNYSAVTVLVDPDDYSQWEEATESKDKRLEFARKAFELSARYEMAIATHIGESQTLRYGENPHQKSWWVPNGPLKGVLQAEKLQGKELSYNNILDADSAWRLVSDLQHQSVVHQDHHQHVVVFKHMGPCGASGDVSQEKALERAWEGDSVSAFGSILAFSHKVDASSAQWLSGKFVELILAPGFSHEALAILEKKKNCRLLALPLRETTSPEVMVRSVAGALVFQEEDEGGDHSWEAVTQKAFPTGLLPVVRQGTLVNKYIKSNALALVRQTETGWELVTSGSGQPNRVHCLTHLIAPKLNDKNIAASSCVLISDAFFPFDDIVKMASEMGIKTIVQPGGSIRDEEVIKTANELEMAMVFTKRRHFRH